MFFGIHSLCSHTFSYIRKIVTNSQNCSFDVVKWEGWVETYICQNQGVFTQCKEGINCEVEGSMLRKPMIYNFRSYGYVLLLPPKCELLFYSPYHTYHAIQQPITNNHNYNHYQSIFVGKESGMRWNRWTMLRTPQHIQHIRCIPSQCPPCTKLSKLHFSFVSSFHLSFLPSHCTSLIARIVRIATFMGEYHYRSF